MYYRDENGDWQEIILEPSGDTLPIGGIMEFGGENAPTGWLICDGSAVSRTDYANLFAVIGTTYGAGDESTTFNLPDFSSRAPVGIGTGTDDNNVTDTITLGQTKGEYEHTLTTSEMPKHQHTLTKRKDPSGLGNYELVGQSGGGTIVNVNTGNAGGDGAHNNIQPVLGVNFIIKAKQAVGVVGTVSEDITDTNENAVPTCETVKDYVDEKQTYSTTETVIGTWIDGKPIYRKVIQYNKTSNGQVDLSLSSYGITNIENIWLNQNSFIKTNNNEWKSVNTYESDAYFTFCTFSSANSFRLSSNSSYARGLWNLIIEYTKTTD